ncbi:MAG: hypothetical protein ACLP9L_42135 [Thermoguttaceae bacterium]
MARNARVAVLGDLDDNGSIMEAGTMRDLGGRRPVHRVVGLLDDGTLKFIGADRADCPAQWRAVWRHRHKLNTNLARWLQTLATEPPEVVLLGAAIGLHAKAARAIARALAELCHTLTEDKEWGPRPRKVARPEPDGSLTVWPSREAAAKALGTSPPVVRDRIADGVLLDAGRG